MTSQHGVNSNPQSQPNTNNSDEVDKKIEEILWQHTDPTFDGQLDTPYEIPEATQAITNLIAQEANKARLDELIWSTGVEYKYERDNKIIQDRIAQLTAQLKAEKGTS